MRCGRPCRRLNANAPVPATASSSLTPWLSPCQDSLVAAESLPTAPANPYHYDALPMFWNASSSTRLSMNLLRPRPPADQRDTMRTSASGPRRCTSDCQCLNADGHARRFPPVSVSEHARASSRVTSRRLGCRALANGTLPLAETKIAQCLRSARRGRSTACPVIDGLRQAVVTPSWGDVVVLWVLHDGHRDLSIGP